MRLDREAGTEGVSAYRPLFEIGLGIGKGTSSYDQSARRVCNEERIESAVRS